MMKNPKKIFRAHGDIMGILGCLVRKSVAKNRKRNRGWKGNYGHNSHGLIASKRNGNNY